MAEPDVDSFYTAAMKDFTSSSSAAFDYDASKEAFLGSLQTPTRSPFSAPSNNLGTSISPFGLSQQQQPRQLQQPQGLFQNQNMSMRAVSGYGSQFQPQSYRMQSPMPVPQNAQQVPVSQMQSGIALSGNVAPKFSIFQECPSAATFVSQPVANMVLPHSLNRVSTSRSRSLSANPRNSIYGQSISGGGYNYIAAPLVTPRRLASAASANPRSFAPVPPSAMPRSIASSSIASLSSGVQTFSPRLQSPPFRPF